MNQNLQGKFPSTGKIFAARILFKKSGRNFARIPGTAISVSEDDGVFTNYQCPVGYVGVTDTESWRCVETRMAGVRGPGSGLRALSLRVVAGGGQATKVVPALLPQVRSLCR